MTTEALAVDREVTLNGLRFHYREWGNPAAPPLVLLHGFTSHSRSWDHFAESVAGDFRVLALDQRGHGESEWTEDYASARRVEDLDAFVAALGLAKFNLLGLSMGGICAYEYAVKNPETLERLVIVDIAPILEQAGIDRIMTGVRERDVFDDPEEAVAQARAANPRPPDWALRHRVLNNLMQTADGKWTYRYDVALRRDRPPQPPTDAEAMFAALARITCPTLLVRGAESDLLGRATAERMAAAIPDCTLVEVSDAGHSVPLDNPEGFRDAVRAWLAP